MVVKSRPDMYMKALMTLYGKPKLVIGNYVESQGGVLVPTRFETMEEARRSGKEIIARSEHVQDYPGSSGLLSSPLLRDHPDVSDEEGLRAKMLDPRTEGVREGDIIQLRIHCELVGLTFEAFTRNISYSYWEKLPGVNRTVVADSAIQGRYHVTSIGNGNISYTIFENGKAVDLTTRRLPEELRAGLPALIESYEKVRDMGKFDPNHCPIMEFVTYGGRDYFLQYHRSRDFEASTFSLDRSPAYGEVEALYVRGATAPGGVTRNVTVAYSWMFSENGVQRLPNEEEGSYDNHYMRAFVELMVRNRKLQVLELTRPDFPSWMTKLLDHMGTSRLMKPEVSVIHKKGQIISDEESGALFRHGATQGEDATIEIHIESDGKRALLRR